MLGRAKGDENHCICHQPRFRHALANRLLVVFYIDTAAVGGVLLYLQEIYTLIVESIDRRKNLMKVSVIVPVYNTERYLRQCVDSILQQSYSDFEILLVDDGSTDNSGKILDEYARKDNRIRVFHQSNRGVAAARKCGIVHSTGEYICFVDSDDTINQDAIQDLLHASREGKEDVVACTTGRTGFISGDEFVSLILINQINPELWGKLYRKSIFDNCQSLDLGKDYPIGEDYLANLEVGLKTKRITCLPKSVYIHFGL